MTSPEMPSHLCSRYILSRPWSRCSIQAGRTASSIATLITPMPSTPEYWTSRLRQGNKPEVTGSAADSASSHKADRPSSRPSSVILRFFMSR